MDLSIYIIQWLTLVTIFTMALLSPGPDLVMAVKNSIIYSRRAGVFTALGFGLGVLVHVTYVALGISALISQSIIVFNIIKWVGAAYLIWVGFQALRSQGMDNKVVDDALKTGVDKKEFDDFKALRSGFFTNVLNPKATLFFLAIFSQIISPETPLSWYVVYGVTCAIMTALWFSLVAIFLTHTPIRKVFMRITKWFDRICGGLLIALGIKVALTAK